jgi:hypothetical protein
MPRSTKASIALLAVGKLTPLNSWSGLVLVHARLQQHQHDQQPAQAAVAIQHWEGLITPRSAMATAMGPHLD